MNNDYEQPHVHKHVPTKTEASGGVSESALSDIVMRFSCPGMYEIKTYTGKVYSIKIIKRGEIFGYWSELTKTFIPVSEFVEVEILRMYSDVEARRFHC